VGYNLGITLVQPGTLRSRRAELNASLPKIRVEFLSENR